MLTANARLDIKLGLNGINDALPQFHSTMATLKHNGARFAGGNYRSRPPKLAVITREQRGRKSGAGKEMALFWVLESLRDNTTNQSRRPLRFENSCFHPDI